MTDVRASVDRMPADERGLTLVLGDLPNSSPSQ